MCESETNISLDQLDINKLAGLLLDQKWMRRCQIVCNPLKPLMNEKLDHHYQAKYTYDDGLSVYLQYKDGPIPGFCWGVEGGEMFSPEVALLSLSKSSPPPILHPSKTL